MLCSVSIFLQLQLYSICMFLSYFTFISNILLTSANTFMFVFSELLLLGEVSHWITLNELSQRWFSCKTPPHQIKLQLPIYHVEIEGYCSVYIYLRHQWIVYSALLHSIRQQHHTGTVRESITIHFVQEKTKNPISNYQHETQSKKHVYSTQNQYLS